MRGQEDIFQELTQGGQEKETVQNGEGGQNLDLWGAFVLDSHEVGLAEEEVDGSL